MVRVKLVNEVQTHLKLLYGNYVHPAVRQHSDITSDFHIAKITAITVTSFLYVHTK